jgi:peptidoglycan hydrolase-like protein with peptidoglycan-binding domain
MLVSTSFVATAVAGVTTVTTTDAVASGDMPTPVTAARSATAAATNPVRFPANPKGLTAPVPQPVEVDVATDYSGQVSCNPVLMPGVRKVRNLALATYRQGRDGGVTRSCVVGGQSEHKEGRAWDWMLNVNNRAERRAAADFLGWLTRNNGVQARRLGVMYVIYNRRMWRTYDMGWTAYTGSSPHTDHIHLSFGWAGARGKTSFWTGRAAGPDYGPCKVFRGQMAPLSHRANPVPCDDPVRAVRRSPRRKAMYGAADKRPVRRAQRLLGLSASGDFDTATWKAVKRYQRAHDLPVTGVLDKPTWASLAPGSITWSVTAGYSPTGAARFAAANFTATEPLRRGSAGARVAFLQRALELPATDRNGYLGRNTAEAVRDFKESHGLVRNAVVTDEVWQALAGNR